MLLEDVISKLNRQFLHAKTLGFVHPKTNEEMIFSSILPNELDEIEENRLKRAKLDYFSNTEPIVFEDLDMYVKNTNIQNICTK